MSGFKAFTHVERIGTQDTEGILNGTCYITPKIDGTNACVWSDGNNFYAGSRTRELSVENDNAGFNAWALSDDPQAVALKDLCKSKPGWIVYGEWLGSGKFIGHIKDYNRDALGHLWVFDVYDSNNNQYIPDDIWRMYFSSGVLYKYTVPYLCVKSNPTFEELLEIAEKNYFLLDNANHPGEGIVVRNPIFINLYGRYCIGKLVRDEYKQDKAKPKKTLEQSEYEEQIVNEFVTDAELSKAKEKTVAYFNLDSFDNHQNKCVGFYLNVVYNDCILEECKNWVKKFKVDQISFSKLKNLTLTKAKEYINL